MPIKTFEFSSVDGRRFVKPTDRWLNLRVDHNSTVTLISELGDRQASVDFRFTANYHASEAVVGLIQDRKSTRLNSSHTVISYAVFCLKKKKTNTNTQH